jgi:hypothetical protein
MRENACCGRNGCLGNDVHGEVAVPCKKRLLLNAQRKKFEALPNSDPSKIKEGKIFQNMMEGMRNIWEPICGLATGGKKSIRKNRTKRNRRR